MSNRRSDFYQEEESVVVIYSAAQAPVQKISRYYGSRTLKQRYGRLHRPH